MSKALAFLALPAFAGLAIWNVMLSSEVSELRDRLADADAAPRAVPRESGKPDGRGDGRGAETPRPETGRANPLVTDLADRVAELEKRAANPVPAPAGAEAAGTPPEGEGWYTSDAFKTAVGNYLEEREEARRQERAKKQAEAMAKMWLRDVQASEAQREQIAGIVYDALRKANAIREDDTLSDDQRRQDLAALDQRRRDEILAVLDAQQAEIVGPRLDQRLRRGPEETVTTPAVQALRNRRRNQPGQPNPASPEEPPTPR